MKFIQILATLATFVAAVASSPVIAQEGESVESQTAKQSALEMRAEQVVTLINGELAPESVFTDAFLTAVPPSQLATIFQQLTSQFGAALSVENLDPAEGIRASLDIQLERAMARGGIAIDAADDDRISELVFQTFDHVDDSPEKIESDLSSLNGKVSAWFGPLDGGAPAIALNEADQMPLGSTFKLYVLASLAREIAQGTRAWDDQVSLNTHSFPSGMMQDWPTGAPVTLHTLASLMISISDNTATDQLIAVLGRDTVLQTVIDSGHSAPTLNTPFLTTRELFLLKGGPTDRLNAYSAANIDTRAQILSSIEDVKVSGDQIQTSFANGPSALDVEWFANASDLANLFRFMRETGDPAAFDIMAINPSMPAATRTRWAYAGYKGGSEPGVLNLTWFLTDQEGRDHAVVLSWSNGEAHLDQTALELIAQRILTHSQ